MMMMLPIISMRIPTLSCGVILLVGTYLFAVSHGFQSQSQSQLDYCYHSRLNNGGPFGGASSSSTTTSRNNVLSLTTNRQPPKRIQTSKVPPSSFSTSPTALNLIAEAVDITTTIADTATATATTQATTSFLQNSDVWIFLAGVFPFAWATVEFWRRVMVGAAFGTGSDQVIIGMDDSPSDSRGRRVLGKGALITAIVLFTISFGTLGVVIYSVVTSGSAPEVFPEATTATAQTIVEETIAL